MSSDLGISSYYYGKFGSPTAVRVGETSSHAAPFTSSLGPLEAAGPSSSARGPLPSGSSPHPPSSYWHRPSESFDAEFIGGHAGLLPSSAALYDDPMHPAEASLLRGGISPAMSRGPSSSSADLYALRGGSAEVMQRDYSAAHHPDDSDEQLIGPGGRLYARPGLGSRAESYASSTYYTHPLTQSPALLEEGAPSYPFPATEPVLGHTLPPGAAPPAHQRRTSTDVIAAATGESPAVFRARKGLRDLGKSIKRASHRVASAAPKSADSRGNEGHQRLQGWSDDEQEESEDELAPMYQVPTEKIGLEQGAIRSPREPAKIDVSLLRGKSLGIFAPENPVRVAMTRLLSHW